MVVYDNEGNQLLEGKTDEMGEFSFKVPRITDLKIVLKASMGHMGEWKIQAEEITEMAHAPGGSTRKIGMEAASPKRALRRTLRLNRVGSYLPLELSD